MANEIASGWYVGTLSHYGLWATYTFFNVVGSALCALLIYCVFLLRKARTSVDVLIGGLCSGCIWLSIPCATQCILNMFHHEFAYGVLACRIEAIFHFIGILVQFFSIALIGIRNYRAVLYSRPMKVATASKLVLVVWVVSIGGTVATAIVSPIYLMPSGTYCFFEFTSIAFIAWFVPAMLMAAAIIAISYGRIFCLSLASLKLEDPHPTHLAIKVEPAASPRIPSQISPSAANMGPPSPESLNQDGSPTTPQRAGDRKLFLTSPYRESAPVSESQNSPRASPKGSPGLHRRARSFVHLRVARQSVMYVVIFLLGWGVAVFCSFYALFVGEVKQQMDAALAIFGVIHSVAVPIAYGYSSQRIRDVLMERWPKLVILFPLRMRIRTKRKHSPKRYRVKTVPVSSGLSRIEPAPLLPLNLPPSPRLPKMLQLPPIPTTVMINESPLGGPSVSLPGILGDI